MASTGLQHKSIEGSLALMVFRFGLKAVGLPAPAGTPVSKETRPGKR
jgi:hypothetical protein